MTENHKDYEIAARKTIDHIGKEIVIGIPLGLGKPIGFINALYQIAKQDKSIQLTIITGLTLARPSFNNELEKRFIQPILDRILKDYEDPAYEQDRVLQQLPDNIRVIEFFLMPGKFLHNDYVQQNYISSSYTNVVRDSIHYAVNVFAQQVAHSKTDIDSYSLSCNTDLFHPMTQHLRQMQNAGKKIAVVAEVNLNLPFMQGKDAVVNADIFTDIIDTGHYRTLFAIPREELSVQDHLIGLYTSCLIKDDSCLQIGIGKQSNALANALILRHKENAVYLELLKELKLEQKFGETISAIGATDCFSKGLFAATEMLSDEYMQLYQAGILKKQVNGKIIHAGFFLGSVDLYQQLNNLSPAELQLFEMASITRTNSIIANYELAKLQYQHARFVNESMIITLGGAAISDGLKNLREVSGVGGQFNFVDMAHKLNHARSILLCRSTRDSKNGITSNIVWDYPNQTIPRYLRDIVVTEYGIADLRSKTDAVIIQSMLNVTDSKFQKQLLKQAKKYGNLLQDYEIPDVFQQNNLANISPVINALQLKGYFKPYPFGSDLTAVENILQHALVFLKNCSRLKLIFLTIMSCMCFYKDSQYEPYLLRMNLKHPKIIKDLIYKKLLKFILKNKCKII